MNRPYDVLALLARAPLPLLVGSFVSGAILSLAAYPLALAGWDRFKRTVSSTSFRTGREKTSRKNRKSSLV